MNPFLNGNPEDEAAYQAAFEANELWHEINWRIIKHNHTDVLHHDTCGLCVLEWALYGGNL